MKGKIFDTTNTLLKIQRIWVTLTTDIRNEQHFFGLKCIRYIGVPLYAVIIENISSKVDSLGWQIHFTSWSQIATGSSSLRAIIPSS